jgi:hypothetical protein
MHYGIPNTTKSFVTQIGFGCNGWLVQSRKLLSLGYLQQLTHPHFYIQTPLCEQCCMALGAILDCS